jgi:hypothetical protein
LWRVTATLVEGYQRDDWVQNLVPAESGLVIDRWPLASAPNRAVFSALYRDIVASSQKQRVLDGGGGVSSLTPRLCHGCDYTLVDILAHGGREGLAERLVR